MAITLCRILNYFLLSLCSHAFTCAASLLNWKIPKIAIPGFTISLSRPDAFGRGRRFLIFELSYVIKRRTLKNISRAGDFLIFVHFAIIQPCVSEAYNEGNLFSCLCLSTIYHFMNNSNEIRKITATRIFHDDFFFRFYSLLLMNIIS